MKKVTLLNMKEQKMLMIFFYSDIFRIIFQDILINMKMFTKLPTTLVY